MNRFRATLKVNDFPVDTWTGPAESSDDAQEKALVVWERLLADVPIQQFVISTRALRPGEA